MNADALVKVLLDAESPKDFLRRRHPTGIVQQMEEMGWTSESKSPWSANLQKGHYWFRYQPVLVRHFPPGEVLMGVTLTLHSVAEFATMRLGFFPVRNKGMLGIIEVERVPVAEALPVLRAWTEKRVTEPPDSEADLPSFSQFRLDWLWLGKQLKMRAEK